MATQETIEALGQPKPEHPATAEIFNFPHQSDGDFSLPSLPRGVGDVLRLGKSLVDAGLHGIETAQDIAKEFAAPRYPEKFQAEMKTRHCFRAEDGTHLTARVFNPEHLDNSEHAIIYNFSLTVPGCRGIEIPTLAEIAAHGERAERSVIAVTSDGLAGPSGIKQLASLHNFENFVRRRFEIIRDTVPPEKRLITVGASLGGMMALMLAKYAATESKESGHALHVDHVISIASALHHKLELEELPPVLRQFIITEPLACIEYVTQGATRAEKIQRGIDLAETFPRRYSQVAAIIMTTAGLLQRSPMQTIEEHVPHETTVVDVTYDRDIVTDPASRQANWDASGHPNINYIPAPGKHMDLLTHGRTATIAALEAIPPIGSNKPLPIAA